LTWNLLNGLGEQEELLQELHGLEEEVLNERLAGADHVPVHIPPNAIRAPECMSAANSSGFL
jgi:charged multivesicular body protein 4